jgi:prevent-host-death family protein
MLTVSIAEAKAHLSSIISTVERGHETVVICRHGQAVAELVPIIKKSRLKTDNTLKNIVINDDLTAPTESEWENV